MEPTVQILISLLPDGNVPIRVNGPGADNKVVLMGLLELAKASILAHREESPIVLARGGLPANGER